MTDDGVLIVNVYDESAKQELLEAMGATMREVFPVGGKAIEAGRESHSVCVCGEARTWRKLWRD